MTEKKVEKLLKEIYNQRMHGQLQKALANLHLLNNEFPSERRYITHLASTYMEEGLDVLALEYCNKALAFDYSEAYELKGVIAEKSGELEQAEVYYKKSVSGNNLFKEGHTRLLNLYYIQAKYDRAVKKAQFILLNFKNISYPSDHERKAANNWISLIYFRLISSLVRLEEHQKAENYIHDYLDFKRTYIKDSHQFSLEK